jgi:hypothetical protein
MKLTAILTTLAAFLCGTFTGATIAILAMGAVGR